jgi:2'-5' RNA ligase
MKGKRVFIGLPAGRELQESACLFRKAHPGLDVRWTRPENLHLTLVPPWQCDDCGPVCRMLQETAARHAPVPVRFTMVAFGPKPRRPGLIWATGSAPEAVATLQRELQAAGPQEGETRRGFLLHLTIARFNAQQYRSFPHVPLPERADWQGTLEELCLYESFLKPGGAEYRVICSAKLEGEAPAMPA